MATPGEIKEVTAAIPSAGIAIRQIGASVAIDVGLAAVGVVAVAIEQHAPELGTVIIASLPTSLKFAAPFVLTGLAALSAWLKKRAQSNTYKATATALDTPPPDRTIKDLYRKL